MWNLSVDSRVIKSKKALFAILFQSIKILKYEVRKLSDSRGTEPQVILLEDHNEEGDEINKVDEKEPKEMARQRHIYETAFDCKVNRSDDELNHDRVTKNPLLICQFRRNSMTPLPQATSSTELLKQKNLYQTTFQNSKDQQRKLIVLRSKTLLPNPLSSTHKQQELDRSHILLEQQQVQHAKDILNASQDIKSREINSINEKNLSNCGYSPSPPSTAPLPAKFHTIKKREQLLFNIRSTSSLINQQQLKKTRSQCMELCINSILQPSEHLSSNENNILESKSQPENFVLKSKELILEFKGKPLKGVSVERVRPRNLVRESKPFMDFKGRPCESEMTIESRIRRELQDSFLKFKLGMNQRRLGYSSIESMATNSSSGSMESLRSSNSEGYRSTSSSESRHSTSLSSHSSDNGSHAYNGYSHQYDLQYRSNFLNCLSYHTNKLHILSPISDKSSQEPASEISDNCYNNSQKASPEEFQTSETNFIASKLNLTKNSSTLVESSLSFKKRRGSVNKNIINSVQSSSLGDTEIQGSDSGISIESRTGIGCNKTFGFQLLKIPPLSLQQQQHEQYLDNINQILENEQKLSDLPFEMPKLRRHNILVQQDNTTSGSATSVDLNDLPFDMPKLRRRLRCTQSTEYKVSQASSCLSSKDVESSSIFDDSWAKKKMSLNLNDGNEVLNESSFHFGFTKDISEQFTLQKPSSLSLGLSLDLTNAQVSTDLVDVDLPLERQGWYHGSITRIEAETVLRLLHEGSYLVRNSESTKQDYSLSLKSARGFMHMRIQKNEELNVYILGQFSKPFKNIPEMVRHFSINRLPIRGAEHMCLLHPVIAQLL